MENPSEFLQQLRDKVEQALRESVLPDADIGVAVENDGLTLKGCVYSASESEKAEAIATATVVGAIIRNELVVKPARARDDVYEAGVESFPASDPPSWMSH